MNEKFFTDNKVNIIAIAKFLWSKRKPIIIVAVLGGVLGLLNAKFSHKIYEASSTVVPNESKSSGRFRGLSGLASLAGISMGSNDGGNISPAMYSSIIESYTFRHKILNQKIQVSSCDTTVTIIEYYNNILQPSLSQKIKKYTIGAPSLLFKSNKKTEEKKNTKQINSKNTVSYTQLERKFISKLNKIIKIEIDEMSGAFTITSQFPDNIGAALIVEHATELLQKFIIDVKIKKAKDNHIFLEERYAEEKIKYEKAQLELAEFEDSNINSVLNKVKSKRVSLESKYQLHNQIFTELSRQLESSKMSLQKDAPVFTIVSKPIISSIPVLPVTIISTIKTSILLTIAYTLFLLFRRVRKEFLKKLD